MYNINISMPSSNNTFRSLVIGQLTKKSKGIVAQRLQIDLLRDPQCRGIETPQQQNNYVNLLQSHRKQYSSTPMHKPNSHIERLKQDSKNIEIKPNSIREKIEALKELSRNMKVQATDTCDKNAKQCVSAQRTSRVEYQKSKIIAKSKQKNENKTTIQKASATRVGCYANVNIISRKQPNKSLQISFRGIKPKREVKQLFPYSSVSNEHMVEVSRVRFRARKNAEMVDEEI